MTRVTPPGFVLGIDVGGSGCRAVLAGPADGAERTATGGAANPHRVGVEGAVHALRGLLGALYGDGPAPTAEAACIGMAGCSHPAIREILRAAFRDVPEPGLRLLVDDGTIAHAAAFRDTPDAVLVMAGTGSGALARAADGALLRVGGLGPLLGDEGGGYRIGVEALREAARALEGRAPRGPLVRRVLAQAGVTGVRQLSQRAAAGLLRPAEHFADVLAAAGEGDPAATALLEGAGRDLADLALRAHGLLRGADRLLLATSGSVLGRGEAVRRILLETLEAATRVPLEDRGHVEEPVRGALWMAREALGRAGSVPPSW